MIIIIIIYTTVISFERNNFETVGECQSITSRQTKNVEGLSAHKCIVRLNDWRKMQTAI